MNAHGICTSISGNTATKMRVTWHARSRWQRNRNRKTFLVRAMTMQMNHMQRNGRSKDKLRNICDNNSQLNMLLLLSLIVHKSENRLVYICSRNVIFSHIIKITMPPLSIRFFTKCMYNDEIKFINISFSSILTNLCKKNIFWWWTPWRSLFAWRVTYVSSGIRTHASPCHESAL